MEHVALHERNFHGFKNSFSAFLATFCIFTLAYRLWFLFSLNNSLNMSVDLFNYASIIFGLIEDTILISSLMLVLFLIQTTIKSIYPYFPKNAILLARMNNLFLYFILVFIALIYIVNKKTILIWAINFSYPMLINSIQQGFTVRDCTDFISMTDLFFLIFPVLLFPLLKTFPNKFLSALNVYFVLPSILIGITISMVIFTMNNWKFHYYGKNLYDNPIIFLCRDLILSFNNPYNHNSTKPSKQQMRSVQFIDPDFAEHAIVSPKFIMQEKKPWNVVIIILESVGTKYIFDETYLNKMPMPFLHALAKKSWYLNNNYTSGNTSPSGLFGLNTGIYPDFAPIHFALQTSLHIPTLATFLGSAYDSFLVQAGSKRFYFPQALFKNSGYKNLYDASSIPIENKNIISRIYLDEQQAVDFFLKRLDNAKQPFLATYYSGAAHYPYFDYPAYRLSNDINNIKIRYYNNLNLLDHQLELIYKKLAEKNWLQNTIIVIAGDHGESFGQHNEIGEFVHGAVLYSEQIKVPVIFYQPKLFAPRIINKLTTSIDILPTILQAMQVHYNVNLFQGESLFRPVQGRKYIFVYNEGNDEIAAIDNQNQKMQISFANGTCKSFNLNNDGNELKSLPCQNQKQETAIIKFRNYQYAMLAWYNRSLVKTNF